MIADYRESECVEFKENNSKSEEIGEYISAIANSAALFKKDKGFIVWGISDHDSQIIGTDFKPKTRKIGNCDLDLWLSNLLNPAINFYFHEIIYEDKNVVLLEISAAHSQPVSFRNIEYIRIATNKKKLKDYPEKEREMWRSFENLTFETAVATEYMSFSEAISHLNYKMYYEILNLSLPSEFDEIQDNFITESFLVKNINNKVAITNLGMVLFAKKLTAFKHLSYKNLRLVFYTGINKYKTQRELSGNKGYIVGFKKLIEVLMGALPSNEIIEKAIRKDVPMFPELALRELIANALIHQDFSISGSGPMIEVFSDRIEITNPGIPIIDIDRLLDSPPCSRNEKIASFFRRAGICEERGSGIDKVIIDTEIYQLPAPIFEKTEQHTRVVLFAHKKFVDMNKIDRIRACYQHASLHFVQRNHMTNTSLRERFKIDKKNSAMASRIISDTLDAGLIKCDDDSVGTKARKYVPFWA